MIDYEITIEDRATVNRIYKDFKALRDSQIKYRKCTYKGRGRPRNEDYIYLPQKALRDYIAYETLLNGFKLS